MPSQNYQFTKNGSSLDRSLSNQAEFMNLDNHKVKLINRLQAD